MFGPFLRIFLIGLAIYVVIALACGEYDRICNYYWWMKP